MPTRVPACRSMQSSIPVRAPSATTGLRHWAATRLRTRMARLRWHTLTVCRRSPCRSVISLRAHRIRHCEGGERMKSDIQIAQEAQPRPIIEIGAEAGLHEDELELYGRYKAKVLPAAYE